MKFSALVSIPPLRACLLLAVILTSIVSASALPVLDRAPNLRPTLPADRNLRAEGLDTDQAVAIAERRYNGRAVGARHLGNGLYRVRILQDNGKVKTVTVRPD